jgi:hypothetical protein
MVQYIFAAAATAAVEPVIGAIGVGWKPSLHVKAPFRDSKHNEATCYSEEYT